MCQKWSDAEACPSPAPLPVACLADLIISGNLELVDSAASVQKNSESVQQQLW